MVSRNFLYFFVFLFVLNVLDVLSTVWFLGVGGVEVNPLFCHLNVVGFGFFDLFVKFLFGWLLPSVSLFVSFRIAKKDSDVVLVEFIGFLLLFFYVFVVLNNLNVGLFLSFDVLKWLFLVF